MTFFIKHPPDDGLPPANREERDLFTSGDTPKQRAAIIAIEECEARFYETGNPIEAINAFMHANDAELYPPLWALEFIRMRFLKASKGGGLERAFGFTASGKGKRTPPQLQQQMDRRNKAWCMNVFKLEALGVARSTAAVAIAALWAERTHESLTGAAILKAVGATESRYSVERFYTLAAAREWTATEKRQLLRSFGAVHFPRKIRKQYGL